MRIKQKINECFYKGKDMGVNLVSQWKVPAKGNYVPYKEVINYGVGGMGRDMVIFMANYLMLNVGNILFGTVLGIRPLHVQTMSTIVMCIDVFLVILRGSLIDNTNTRWGRYRPYIALTAVPLFILAATFMYLPFETMTYSKKLMLVFSFGLGMAFIRPYFDFSFGNIGNVITPNTNERAKIIAMYGLIYSAAPTVYGALIPLLSVFTGGYTDIRTYRYVIVPIAFIGVFLSFFAVFGVKERFVVPKGYKPRVNVFKSAAQVYKNKYWWLRMTSGWLAFLEGAAASVFIWSFIYGSQDMAAYAFYGLILGSSATFAMIFTPMLLKRFGNRKVIVVQNAGNVILFAFIFLTFRNPFVFFIFWFINCFLNFLSMVYSPAFNAEVNDYQQYISGKRVDGATGVAGIIALPISMVTAYAIPAIFEMLGITTNYDILYDPNVRNNVFQMLIICSMIGATLNLIPLFFYDYSHAKHRNIIKVLMLRAMLVEYSNGDISNMTIKRGLDGYYSYHEIMNAPMPDMNAEKEKVKLARSLPKSTDEEKIQRASAIKSARKNYRAMQELIVEKKEAKMYTKELNKFDNELMIYRLGLSREVVDTTIEGLCKFTPEECEMRVVEAKSSGLSKAELKIKIAFLRNLKKRAKMISKTYPQGIFKPNDEDYIRALALPHINRKEMIIRFKAIKTESKIIQRYNKCLEFFTECKELVDEYNVKQDFHLLEAMYNKACAEIDAEDQENVIKIAEEKKLKAERLLALKEERTNKKRDKLIANGESIDRQIDDDLEVVIKKDIVIDDNHLSPHADITENSFENVDILSQVINENKADNDCLNEDKKLKEIDTDEK